MGRRFTTLVAGAALVPALLFAGCGGGDDEETAPQPQTTAATTLSKQELLAQGDAICAEVNAAVGAVGSTSAEGAGEVSQLADLYGGMVERLEGLGAPSGDEGAYEEFIEAARGLAQARDDAALAAERGEDGALATAETEASSALEAFRSAATGYGFERCGEAPSAPSATPSAPDEDTSAEGGLEAPEEAPQEEYVPPVEEEAEAAPETDGGTGEDESTGGGASPGGEEEPSGGGGSNSGGIGPG